MNEHMNQLGDLARLVNKIAVELVFAQPGKDDGLLPISSLLGELEESAARTPEAAPLGEALKHARVCLEQVFANQGLFDAASLEALSTWSQWMQNALPKLENGQPLPPFATAPSAPPPVAAAPSSPAPVTTEEATEESMVLNLESDQELLREFINESDEHLNNIEQGVLTLEEHPTDADTLNSIFRAFHTFKGGSGFLNLKPINRLAHELESLLDLARQQKLAIDSAVINVILEGGDTLRRFVQAIARRLDGKEGDQAICIPTQRLLRRTRQLVEGGSSGKPASAPAAVPTSTTTVPAAAIAPVPPPPAQVASPAPPQAPPVEKVVLPLKKESAAPAKAEATEEGRQAGANRSFVKVDTLKLDSLVDLVGEMVIAQSLVLQDDDLQSLHSQRLARNLAQLIRITRDLQRLATSLRMVPIRSTFQKMTRLVRDLSVKAGKQVELQLSGEDTEVDRTIVEEISDPLVHMIRNSVDHGIEAAEARLAKGKPPYGKINLRALHQGGSIVVEVEDDGAGLNKDRILAKAVERGLVPPGSTLSDKEIFDLIFKAGFSTAEKVTDISGRGVGMDVVRRNIERLRGKVEIRSVPGRGTSFTIYLPLTLAIIEGLLVGVGGERFILPTLSVRESFRPTKGMIASVCGGGELVNVRGQLIPLLRLHQRFDLAAKAATPEEGIVVVVEADNQRCCLLVDQLLGKQEVVIKGLGELFRDTVGLAGAAILGDGRVGLILDVDALVSARVANVAQAA